MDLKKILDEVNAKSKRFITDDDLLSILSNHELSVLEVSSVIEFLEECGIVVGKDIYSFISSATESGHRTKNTTFDMINIPLGAELTYINDHSITAKTLDGKNKIQLSDGRIGSISTITRELEVARGATDNPKQGARYWKYNGKTLWEIRKDLLNE